LLKQKKAGIKLFVVDTYALFEWLVYNNQKYKKYFEQIDNEGAYITELVLMEFYHKIFHEEGKEKAEEIFHTITTKIETIKLNAERIKKTGEKRSQMLKERKKLSYADCLNLVIAEENKAKVLTGDKEFKNLKNTEFVE